jgi:hypothetical protein
MTAFENVGVFIREKIWLENSTTTIQIFGNVTVPLRLSSWNNQHFWSAQLNVALRIVFTQKLYRKKDIRAVRTLELLIPTNIHFLHCMNETHDYHCMPRCCGYGQSPTQLHLGMVKANYTEH